MPTIDPTRSGVSRRVLLSAAGGVALGAGGVPMLSKGVTPTPVNLNKLLAPRTDLRKFKVDKRRTLTFTTAGGFAIDGKPFDPNRIDQVCEIGALEQWTIKNPTGLTHPFHIHVNPFQVVSVNGTSVDTRSYEDTVLVDKLGGEVTFLTRFEHFLGRVIYHCHFGNHSDLGMMGQAWVVPRGCGTSPIVPV